MTEWRDAYIGLGANLGDREQAIRAAAAALDELRGVEVITLSTLIETDPVGPPDQPRYLNAAARCRTDLPARRLLDMMLGIEAALGRARTESQRWGPRCIDLDLLVLGFEQIDEPGLCVPHPRLAARRFVLDPLGELAPDLIIPGQTLTVAELRDQIGT